MSLKSIKKPFAWTALLLLFPVLIIGGGYIALRSPQVQTKITKYIAKNLSEELKTVVSVQGVDIGFFNRVILQGVFLQDLHGDTLGYMQNLHLGISSFNIDENSVYFNRITIDGLKLYVRKYGDDKKLNTQFLMDYFSTSEKDGSSEWDIRSEQVELRNASFQYQNNHHTDIELGVDYWHLDVRKINLLITEMRLDVDTIYGNLERMNFKEHLGFTVEHIEGKVKVSAKELKVDNLKIRTAISSINLDLHYTYNTWRNYLTFIDSVRMDYTFRESVVYTRDVAFFAPKLGKLKEKLIFSGRVYGAVSSLNGRNLNIKYGKNTLLQGDVDFDGLPNISETFVHFNLKRFASSYADIISMPMPPFNSGERIKLPKNIANLGRLDFRGNFSGFINDFVAFGKLKTDIGIVKTDVSLKQDAITGIMSYDGGLKAIGFDIGKFLGVEKVGKVTLNAKISGSGFSKEDVNARLVGEVQSVKLIGYEYRNIEVNGMFVNSQFNGDLRVGDKNVDMVFHGGIDLSQQLPEFIFNSHVSHADLYQLNLLRKREDATVSGTLEVNFRGDDIDNIIGNISVLDATYQQKGDSAYTVNSFKLIVVEDSLSKKLQLKSDVVDANFSGKFNFSNIRKAVNNLLRKHLPSYARDFEFLKSDEALDFVFDVKLKKTDVLSYFLLPELKISDGADFSGSYSTNGNELFLRGLLPEAMYGTTAFSAIQIEAENPGKEFELAIYADAINFTDSLFLKNVAVRTFTFNDSLGLVVKWDNQSKMENSAFIHGVASFEKDQQISFHLKQSDFAVAGTQWQVDPRNLITIDSSTFSFTHFQFNNNQQSISLNGIISKSESEKLTIGLNRFDLSSLNLFSRKTGLTLLGEVSGTAQLSGLYSELFLTNQLSIDSLVVNQVMIGSGELNSTWIPATRTVQIFGLLQHKNSTTLTVVGEYLPGKNRIHNFNLKALVDKIPLSVFNPYVKRVLSEIDGTMMASISIKGTREEPELSGKVVLREAAMRVNYFNTSYSISDTVLIKNDGFYFTDLLALDERGSEAIINGSIKHSGFKDFQFNMRLEATDFLAMNTNSAMNSLYYGRGIGTGIAKFTGDPKKMHFDVSMRSERGTRFHIPLFGAETVENSDFITFVKPENQEKEYNFEEEFQVEFENVTVDLDIEVTEDARVQLIFDPKVGDVIKGRGSGDIQMSLDRTGTFKMFGDYYINKGEYLFTLQNIINKKFLIKQGGTINWSGDPYDALVNIEANYRVRTSLYDLMYPDTTEEDYRKRVQVDCILKMTDNLMNPKIAFEVNLPNSDERINTEVRNRIGVGNEQEMNRQVFGLMVLNKFLPPENKNVAQETGGFFTSSSAEVLSNQVSNWLSKLSNDFDVGLNYRPGDDITNDELELALSTQVFNNRIIVDGNVGVTNTQSSASNIVGDVNIEYKITSDGKFRIRAFNKSNDINTLTNNAPFTQGVGISFQKNFDRLGDLFRRRTKKKREEERP